VTRRPIGYYVHHHGAGHRARADAIIAASHWPIVLLGTGIGADGIDLPDDRQPSGRFDGEDDAQCRPQALHYAPLDHQGVRARVATVASWIAQERPALMVVDVSVEIAMLARLASVPTICVRLNGTRDDPAHLDAFRGASGLLAPFAAALDCPAMPGWVRDKTAYFPGIAAAPASSASVAQRVLVVFGRGGPPGDGTLLAHAARACPQWQWRVIGPATRPADVPSNLSFAGWVDSPEREIAESAIVVGAAGGGLVSAVMAADRPFVCIPEPRPFGEQEATGARLGALGAAVAVGFWPGAADWPDLIDRAMALPPQARRSLSDPEGAQKATAWLARYAAAATSAPEPAA
jgi:hypothetical protein